MKKIMTLIGIRPDIIRMSSVIKKLDQHFDHKVVWSGQHYDDALFKNFFEEFGLRTPDFNLNCGVSARDHFDQLINGWRALNSFCSSFKPDAIIFLGDSNTVLFSIPLKKNGHKIVHIEAGMRSGDRMMMEEINRTCCDNVADIFFTYHHNYSLNLIREGKNRDNIFNVGNTIVEPCLEVVRNNGLKKIQPTRDFVLLDIHRNENITNRRRLKKILDFASYVGHGCNLPVFMLGFNRTLKLIKEFEIKQHDNISVIPLKSFVDHTIAEYNAYCIISDSGTDQEQAALLKTPVIVPRDYTERPESVDSGCSYMLTSVTNFFFWKDAIRWLKEYYMNVPVHNYGQMTRWLGDGNTSNNIVQKLKDII